MQRIPLNRVVADPRKTNNFLDTCAFDPKYSPEHEAAQQIRALASNNHIYLVLTHSNQKEVDHPNTPVEVKREAAGLNFTIETMLTSGELARKRAIHKVLAGNGKHEKHAADAAHVFEAGKYVGYFITTDQRILSKRQELSKLSAATIVTPNEWLKVYYETDG